MADKVWAYEAQVYNAELREVDNIELGPFLLYRGQTAEDFIAARRRGDIDPFAEMTVNMHWPNCRLRITRPEQTNEPAIVNEELDQAIAILRLWRPGGIGRLGGWSATSVEDARGNSMALPRPYFRGSPFVIEMRDIEELKNFFSHWYPVDHSGFEIVWERFNSSYSRLNVVDAFIDLLVALEAAFGDDDPVETRFKIALRGALFIEEDDRARKKTYDLLTKAYRERSRVLHGRSDSDWVAGNVGAIEDFVRRTVLAFAKKANEAAPPSGTAWNAFLFWPTA
jgi:hypothetical protein